MSSTSEVGHAKNIANLNLLNTHIIALGATYNPSNPKLFLTNLQNIYTTTFSHQESVNSFVTPYCIAVDEREAIFKPLNRELTKLRKAYKATGGVTQAELEDFMTIVRKLKGVKKTATTASTNPEEETNSHSTSQMSYDQRTNTMDLLISLLQNTPNYNPNENEFKGATYQAKKVSMLAKTQAVADTFIPLNNARSVRNTSVQIRCRVEQWTSSIVKYVSFCKLLCKTKRQKHNQNYRLSRITTFRFYKNIYPRKITAYNSGLATVTFGVPNKNKYYSLS